MMETLNPSAYFLRVSDKFFGEFICRDKAVSDGPTLLYLTLFRKAYKGGVCRSSQTTLARLCKCSVRSIQHHLRALAALKYISIEQQEDGRNVYRLLLSQRVLFFIAQEISATDDDDGYDNGEEFSSCHAKNLRMGGENSSPVYKSDKSSNTPLSPHTPAKANREALPSTRTRTPSRSTMPVPTPQAGGWGDSCSRERRGKSVFQQADALFERFFAAYPRKEAKESARAAWHQLWRRGALPALEELTASLERFRTSAQWLKEHGRFVPFLVNWLRGQRWADVTDAPGSSSPGVQSVPSSGAPTPFTPTAENPRHAQALRHCLQRLEERHRTDPALDAARPAFEAFLSHFADGQRKRGPAWGLWASLFQRGKAPSAEDVKERGMMDAFAFLQAWQRGEYATA